MLKQAISIAVFIGAYFFIGFERVPKMYIAIFGAIVLIFFNIFGPGEVITYVNWDTIGFLFGIFITLKIIEESGFFNYLSLRIGKAIDYDPLKLLIVFPALAWFLSGFVDSITVLVFMAPLTYALSRILRFEPIPFIVAEVCLANIGGAGTLMGDPPNVILGSMFNLGFTDFVKHNWIISLFSGLAAIAIFYKMNKSYVLKNSSKIEKRDLSKLVPEEAIEDQVLMKIGLSSLFATVVLLIIRDFLKIHMPLDISLCALIPAFSVLAFKGNLPKLKGILMKTDIETLVFFIGLFIIVGGLEKTGIIQLVASKIGQLSESKIAISSTLFWGGAFSSAFIDNVPEAMSIGYLIKHITPQLTYQFTLLIWASSLGLDIGGSFTPIGASANVVGYGFMEKQGIRIGWWKWIRLAFLPTIAALFVCWLGLLLKIIIGYY